MKKWISILAILLVTVTLLGFLQALLMPKYMAFEQREGRLIAEYYDETLTTHDVVFIGDCEVYESFTPPTLWEEYGITSYIRGSAQQLIWQSYYLLEETLQKETPRVVVFNVLAVKYGEPQSEACNRMTLDGMEWSHSKIEAIKASMTKEENFLSYVFPLLRYHSRWSELTGEDLKYLFDTPSVSHNGYLMQTGVDPMTEVQEPMKLFDYTIPEISFEYLEKMRLLCEEKGVEFVLVKAPTNHVKYYWYDEWEAQIVKYAAENGVDYYNLIPKEEEIGLDWSTDTYDRGLHLNVYGAEKTTAYFGKILQEKYGLTDYRDDAFLSSVWSQKLTAYNREKGENQ